MYVFLQVVDCGDGDSRVGVTFSSEDGNLKKLIFINDGRTGIEFDHLFSFIVRNSVTFVDGGKTSVVSPVSSSTTVIFFFKALR